MKLLWFSHVAVWHEDMVELIEKSYVDGIELITEYEASLAYWEKHKDLYYEQTPGKFVPVSLPKPEPSDDPLSDPKTFPVIASTGIGVSEAGRGALRSLLSSGFENAPEDFRDRVEPLLAIGKADTAV